MPESPETFYARALAAADAERRLPVPPIGEWDTCPWDGDIRIRPLQPPAAAETSREGTGGVDCSMCDRPERNGIWRNERWTVRSTSRPTGLPLVLFLVPREHLDYTDLDDDHAAECGQISVRLTRIVESLPEIARCHVIKIGDGAEHLHLWFMARPARMDQFRGSFAVEWDDILPPVPEETWRADLVRVARALGSHGGTVLV